MNRRRHTPERVIRKLRELIGWWPRPVRSRGAEQLEIVEATYHL
jgi:hypothetical protein